MTDGTRLNSNTTTGDLMASDDIADGGKFTGMKTQVIKFAIGASASADLVSVLTPMPVAIAYDGEGVSAAHALPVTAAITAIVPGTDSTALGKAASASANANDVGVAMLAKRIDTAATIGPLNNQYSVLQLDSLGNLRVNVAAGGIQGTADDATFSATSGLLPIAYVADETATDSIDEGDAGVARMTLDRKQIMAIYPHTAGGWSKHAKVCGIGLNATNLKASAGQVGFVYATNEEGATVYLKLYDKASAPDPGSNSADMIFGLPNGFGGQIAMPPGVEFSLGIGYSVTRSLGAVGAASLSASTVCVTIGYK